MTAESVAWAHLARVIIDNRRHEDQLQVGHWQVGVTFEKCPRFGEGRRHQALALTLPLHHGLEHLPTEGRRESEGVGFIAAAVGDDIVDMVL
ncbi:hypothetical protein D3C77_438870 [compost metagenome]